MLLSHVNELILAFHHFLPPLSPPPPPLPPPPPPYSLPPPPIHGNDNDIYLFGQLGFLELQVL